MSLEICALSDEHKDVIWNMFQFYCYDTSIEDVCDLEESGLHLLSPEYFSQYWELPTWSAHLLRWEGEIAGFVLLQACDAIPGSTELTDLFVMKRFRRLGIARQVARHFLAERAVSWSVVIFDEAKDARAFWHSVFTDPLLAPSRQLIHPEQEDATVHVLEPTIAA